MAIYAAVAAAVIGVVGAVKKSQAASQAAKYQGAVAQNNEVIAGQYAKAELDKGQRLEDAKRLETAQRISGVRTGAAARGLDVNSGSALTLQEDTARLGEVDALTIRNNAARAAYGYEVQGLNFQSQANMSSMAGGAARTEGTLAAWSSALSSVGSYAQSSNYSSIMSSSSSVSSRWDSMRTPRATSPFMG